MKGLLLSLAIGSYGLSHSQYSVHVKESSYGSDIVVKVGENILYADLDVEIGENILSEDFSVGFTNSKYEADVIISNSPYTSDFSVSIISGLYADLDIDVSSNQIYEDISIEIKSSGTVDYLVYNENALLSKEQLVVSLLPIINAYLEYKFDDIPFWSAKNGIGEPQDVLEPQYYCCPGLGHWINSNNEGILILEDRSMWVIYQEDRYLSLLWLPIDNVKITTTEYFGHYYITNKNEILNTSETVRAIFVGNKR